MKTTYLKDYLDSKIAYLPVGTVEWHGNHLSLETDAIIAEKVCEMVVKEIPGYVLPSIYLGTDKEENDLRGMERHIGKKLEGEVYFLDPGLLLETLNSVAQNLQKFEKVFIITGHAGTRQIEVLEKVDKQNKKVVFIDPYKELDMMVRHADETETSLLWAAKPTEEARGKAIKIDSSKDDFFKWLGYDAREKASLEKGQEILDSVVKSVIKRIKENLG